jgi:hypothetical protein
MQLSLIRIVISPTQIELFQRNPQVCSYTFDQLARTTLAIFGALNASDGSPIHVEGISEPLLSEVISQASLPEGSCGIEALAASDNTIAKLIRHSSLFYPGIAR